MTPFALAIREDGFENPKLFKSNDEVTPLHNIQTHTADLSLLVSIIYLFDSSVYNLFLFHPFFYLPQERAQQKQDSINRSDSNSDDLVSSPHVSNTSILTPPKSVSKHK